MKDLAAKLAFFKQTGWMVVATTVGGVLMYAVHIPASRMPTMEYAVLITLLQVLNQMGIPTQGLQNTFARQAAAAESEPACRQLRGTVQGVLQGVLVLWLALGGLALWQQSSILQSYKITHPEALWATIFLGLAALCNPVAAGLLQGRQNFLWLGNMFIINAGGRFLLIALIVLGAASFSASEFKDLPGLGRKLASPADPVSVWLAQTLPPATRQALVRHTPEDPGAAALRETLEENFNALIAGPCLFEPARFAGVALSPKTRELLESRPEGKKLERLNRLLLEEAYPGELKRGTTFGLGYNHAAGAMTAIVLSMFAAMIVSGWQVRHYVFGPRDPFDWKPWLRQVVPLTLGLGASTFMFTEDMIIVQKYFLKDTGLYGAAGTIGRALVFFVAPMTYVMFPKIVRSAARQENTSVMWQALGVTALMGVGAAGFLTLFPALPLQMVQGSKYLSAAPLVPWFAWSMLPLTLSNVLLNNLLARGRYQVVPWVVALAAGYFAALNFHHPSFLAVIQTLGLFGTLFLAVCVAFTWKEARAATAARA